MQIMGHHQMTKHLSHGNPRGRREKEGAEGLFKVIIPENFPNLGRDYGYPGTGSSNSKQDQSKEDHFKAHYNVKSKRQAKNFESNKRKMTHYIQGNSIRLSVDFSAENLQTRREWNDRFKVLKEKLPNQNSIPRKTVLQK